MKKVTYLLTMLFLTAFSWQGMAQTFTGSTGAVPDNACPTTTDYTATATGVGTLGATNQFDEVVINISHTWGSDLQVWLLAPDGTTQVELTTGNGGNGTQYTDTHFRADASNSITTGSGNFTGNWLPEGDLSTLDGLAGDGTWTLQVCDGAGGDTGSVDSWEITFVPVPACPNPTGLTANNFLPAGTADVSWTAAAGAATYNWEIQPQGTAQGTAGAIDSGSTTDPTVMDTAMGLVDGTDYTLYVQADCGGATSAYVSLDFTFTVPVASNCGAYTSSPGTATIDNSSITDDIVVTGTGPQVLDDLNVVLDINHTWLGDLTITLTSPGSTSVVVYGAECGNVDDMLVMYDDEAAAAFDCNDRINVVSIPSNALSAFDGEVFDGTWTLEVADSATGDGGTLNQWCLIPTLVAPPACPNVTGLTADNFMAAGTADVSWAAAAGAATYNWEIQPQGTAQGTPGAIDSGSTTDPTVMDTAMSLVHETAYTLYVQADCGASQGAYSSLDFTFIVNNTIGGALPITPSPEGTGCATFTFTDSTGGDGTTDSGLDGSCNGANTGLDRFYSWTATSEALVWNDGAGNPGIVIRDSGGTEITCSGTFAGPDTVLSGWTVGQDLIIQVYDFGAADVDTSFCLEELNAPDCVDTPSPADGATDVVTTGGALTVTWANAGTGGTPTSYEVFLGTVSGTLTSQGTVNAPTTSFNLTGLAVGTQYFWQVIASNDAGAASSCAEWDFTTETPSCADVSGLMATNFLPAGTADISWTAAAGAATYNWEIQPQGTAQGTPGAIDSGMTTDPTVTDTAMGLVDGTDYTLYVQSDCGASQGNYLSLDFTFDVPITANCGAYTSSPGTATIDNSSITDDIVVTGTGPQVIDDLNLVVDISHTWLGDLTITLTSPTGTDVVVYAQNCGNVDDMAAMYDDEAGGAFDCNDRLNVTVTPNNALSAFDGEIFDGTWTLEVADGATGDGGTLNQWCLVPTLVAPPACPNVTGLTADNFTAPSSADVSWNAAAGAATYNWEIQPQGTAQGTPGAIDSGSTTDPTVMDTATGLVSGTDYTLYVQADCGGSQGAYASLDFTYVLPPVNNDCANATALTVGAVFADNAVVGTNVASTASGETPNPSCSSFGAGQDVWYSVTVPTSGNVTIETNSDAGSTLDDTGMQVYSGTCGGLVAVECDDDDSADGFFSLVSLTGRTPGEVLLVRIFEFGNNTFDTFQVSAYDGTCGGGTTTWDGAAWDNGAPGVLQAAIIDGAYVTGTNGDITACNIAVTASGSLTVSAAGFASSEGNIHNEGSISVEATGSVVQVDDNATVTGAGTFTTTITTTSLQDEFRFTYFSSPSASGDLSLFAYADSKWSYDEGTQEWVYIGGSATGGAMEVGKGYAIEGGSGGAETINFTGAFNNGLVSHDLAFDIYNNVVADYPDPAATDDDSNFLGNPYPSGISADDFLNSNDVASIHMWTHESPLEASPTPADPWAGDDYIDCVVGTCTSAPSGGPNAAHTGIIASGQGFFAIGTALTSAVFNNAMRRTTGNDQFRNTDTHEKLWLDMTSNIGYDKQIALTFTENGTDQFDLKYESRSFTGAYGLGFYSINAANDKLTINDTGLFSDERVIPLGYYINSNRVTDITISIDHFQNLDDVNVYLRDNLLNTLHDLKIDEYTVPVTETGEVDDRFEIVFTRESLSTTNEVINDSSLVVSNYSDTEIKVNMLDGNIITGFKAFDIVGKVVIDIEPNSNNFIINNANIKQGQVLFIQATLENGQVLSNKFMKL